MMKSISFHDAANIFPLDDEHIDELAADIKAHGLLCPVELCDGKIIDGRRRWQACRIAGVEAATVEVSPEDPVAYVLSLNLHRRHLTPSQRSMVGERAEKYYAKLAEERQFAAGDRGGEGGRGHKKNPSGKVTGRVSGDARDQAGKAVGVSGSMIDRAKKVRKHGVPELVEAVEKGKMSVTTAAKLADEPADVQKEAAETAEFSGGRYRMKATPKESEPNDPGHKLRGVGVFKAEEAINVLKTIPKNDALRKRGFQIVSDWLKRNL